MLMVMGADIRLLLDPQLAPVEKARKIIKRLRSAESLKDGRGCHHDLRKPRQFSRGVRRVLQPAHTKRDVKPRFHRIKPRIAERQIDRERRVRPYTGMPR